MPQAIGGANKQYTVGGLKLSPTADNNPDFGLGGNTNSVEDNGDGTLRVIVETKGGRIEGLEVAADPGKLEALQKLANDPFTLVPFTVTRPDGRIYQAMGIVTGDVQEQNGTATITFDFHAEGSFTLQS